MLEVDERQRNQEEDENGGLDADEGDAKRTTTSASSIRWRARPAGSAARSPPGRHDSAPRARNDSTGTLSYQQTVRRTPGNASAAQQRHSARQAVDDDVEEAAEHEPVGGGGAMANHSGMSSKATTEKGGSWFVARTGIGWSD